MDRDQTSSQAGRHSNALPEKASSQFSTDQNKQAGVHHESGWASQTAGLQGGMACMTAQRQEQQEIRSKTHVDPSSKQGGGQASPCASPNAAGAQQRTDLGEGSDRAAGQEEDDRTEGAPADARLQHKCAQLEEMLPPVSPSDVQASQVHLVKKETKEEEEGPEKESTLQLPGPHSPSSSCADHR